MHPLHLQQLSMLSFMRMAPGATYEEVVDNRAWQ
jgi:hypothetical protein